MRRFWTMLAQIAVADGARRASPLNREFMGENTGVDWLVLRRLVEQGAKNWFGLVCY